MFSVRISSQNNDYYETMKNTATLLSMINTR